MQNPRKKQELPVTVKRRTKMTPRAEDQDIKKKIT